MTYFIIIEESRMCGLGVYRSVNVMERDELYYVTLTGRRPL